MDNRFATFLLIVTGAGLIVLGLLIRFGALSWFGKLPGDIMYEGQHTKIYFPLASMLVITVVLNILIYILRRIL
jgi:hypothetical protein